MKIAVLHDFFAIKGGGERVVMSLAKHFDADLIYGFWRSESYSLEGYRATSLNSYTPIPGWRTMKQIRAFQNLKNLDAYDRVIYSGTDAVFARKNRTRKGNIYYCHTPPRNMYDKKDYFAKQSVGGRIVSEALSRHVRPGYEAAVQTMDMVIANSKTTQSRIKNYLHRDAVVVYPPCDTDQFTWIEQGEFYLSTARLDSLKNVDRIVETFKKMPDKKLVVVSGGPQEKRIRAQAAGSPNITVLGWADEATLRSYVGRCIATLYMADDEDFGMSPVESMAAGKPVIGVASGGLTETVIHKQSGCLIRPDFTEAHLQEAVEWMTPARALEMRVSCENQAKSFSTSQFLQHMEAVISQAAE